MIFEMILSRLRKRKKRKAVFLHFLVKPGSKSAKPGICDSLRHNDFYYVCSAYVREKNCKNTSEEISMPVTVAVKYISPYLL